MHAFTCEFRQAPNTVAVLFYYGRAEAGQSPAAPRGGAQRIKDKRVHRVLDISGQWRFL